jgi:hypothetical protein
MREVVVNFLVDLKERSSITFSITRPLRELPGNSGYGVVWNGSVYPLHQFDGAAGHTHLEGLQLHRPEDCPVVTETIYLDGSSDRVSVRGAIDMAGHYNYLFLDCRNEFIEEIVDCLDEMDIGTGIYGPGNKASRNGRIYEHFIRLRPSHLMPGSDPKASIMTALSMAGFDLVIDDFWEPGDLEEFGASTKREPELFDPEFPEPSLDHANSSLKILERETESLRRGFEIAGWSHSQVDSLSDKLRQHALNSVPRLDSGTDDVNDDVMRAIIDERAELIGAWALDKLKQVPESATIQIETLSAKSTDQNSQIDRLTRDLRASKQLSRKATEDPASSSKGEVGQVEVLRPNIKEIEKHYNALRHEHQRIVEERDDLEHERDRALDRIHRLEAMSHNWDDPSEIVGDFCATWGTKIELLRDSEARLASREFSDRKPLLKRLLTLNHGDMPLGTHPVQGKARQKGWNTTHFPTGQGSDGRIYYRQDGQKMRILISRKSSQDQDIDNLLSRL